MMMVLAWMLTETDDIVVLSITISNFFFSCSQGQQCSVYRKKIMKIKAQIPKMNMDKQR